MFLSQSVITLPRRETGELLLSMVMLLGVHPCPGGKPLVLQLMPFPLVPEVNSVLSQLMGQPLNLLFRAFNLPLPTFKNDRGLREECSPDQLFRARPRCSVVVRNL